MEVRSWPNGNGFNLVGENVDTEVWVFDDSLGVRNFVSETWLRVPLTVELMGRFVPLNFPVFDLPERCARLGQPLES